MQAHFAVVVAAICKRMPTNELEAFGKRVAQERRHKAVREERDVMPTEVANAIGVALSTYQRWEGGEVWPRDPALNRLAEYFGVQPAWLRYGVGPARSATRTGLESSPTVAENRAPPSLETPQDAKKQA